MRHIVNGDAGVALRGEQVYAWRVEKTHAMRVLEARGFTFDVKRYDASGAFHSADEAAALLGVDSASVYKTLVVLREGDARAKPLLVMVAAPSQIDLKTLAKSIGTKKLRMATQREAERLTGMQAGGISALGLKQPGRFEILIDEAVRGVETIHVSAGARGIDLALNVDGLVAVTGAKVVRAC
jgi:Cys-tRNA(Pro)/Cys-tRNA(Cys) deacylase